MTGRAAIFEGPGRPIRLIEQAVPVPAAGEVVARVTCCTLCGSDLHTHAGRRSEPTPAVLGHEVVGRVAAVGPGRSDLAVGQRITWAVAVSCGSCERCARGWPQKCERLFKSGHARHTAERPFAGGLADYCQLMPNTAICLIPDATPDRLASLAACAGATAAAVVRAAGPLDGRDVLVFGGGALGLFAGLLARQAGAAGVTVIDPDGSSRRRAERFGLSSRATADGLDADVVCELAGAASAVRSALDATRTAGTLILAGTVSPVEPIPLPPEAVVRRCLTIRGMHNYAPADLQATLAALAGPLRDLPWEELFGQTFPLHEVEAAFASGHAHAGRRVVVRPCEEHP
jgi:putative phosphonate catabolism associated alcohol dehydrogenase